MTIWCTSIKSEIGHSLISPSTLYSLGFSPTMLVRLLISLTIESTEIYPNRSGHSTPPDSKGSSKGMRTCLHLNLCMAATTRHPAMSSVTWSGKSQSICWSCRVEDSTSQIDCLRVSRAIGKMWWRILRVWNSWSRSSTSKIQVSL